MRAPEMTVNVRLDLYKPKNEFHVEVEERVKNYGN